MLTEQQIAAYHRDGYILVENVLSPELLGRVRDVVEKFVEQARGVTESNAVYDFEDSHTPQNPRVRRLKDPVRQHPIFWEIVRSPAVSGPLMQLIGPDIRLFGSKLNMKAAGYGAPVEWHQDWAFYPHTNDDLLAIGIMLDDVTSENGALRVLPGSHRGPVYDHRSEEGFFVGAIRDVNSQVDLSKAVPIYGRAGSMSVHHVRAVHGSALNLSGQPRRMLFYEMTAADAWPLWSDVTGLKYRDLENFNEQMIVGEPTMQPRMEALPVRMPGPYPGGKVDGIYALQSKTAHRHFQVYKETATAAAK